jgi:hypothetical protein
MTTAIAEAPRKLYCRYIKSDGLPCRGVAIRGQLYCYSHGRDLRRYANASCSSGQIYIPRLDNRADIQQLVTDVARALAAGALDHSTARLLMATARLASHQLPPPRDYEALRRSREKDSHPVPEVEPVEDVVPGPNGEDLAPETPYYGPQGKPERKWSFAEYLYHNAFPGNEDKPLPEEGYLKHDFEAEKARPAAPPQPEAAILHEPGPPQQQQDPQPLDPQQPDPLILDRLYAIAEIAVPKYHPTQTHECKDLARLPPVKIARSGNSCGEPVLKSADDTQLTVITKT